MNLRKDHCSLKVVCVALQWCEMVKWVVVEYLLKKLITMDILALESMKNAAKCDK